MDTPELDDNTLVWLAKVDGKTYGNSVMFTKESLSYVSAVADAIKRDIVECFKSVTSPQPKAEGVACRGQLLENGVVIHGPSICYCAGTGSKGLRGGKS